MNDDLRFVVVFDDLGSPAHLQNTVARLVQIPDLIDAADDAARGEVRPRKAGHKLGDRGCGMIQQIHGGIDDLAQIVRRNAGGHSHADTHAPVDQKVGELGRQNFRLQRLLVEGGDHGNRFLLDIRQKLVRQTFHAALRIPVGSRRVAIDVSEVPLPFDEGIPHGKVLRHTDQRIVHRGVAVRMIVAQHFADHLRALHRGMRLRQPHLTHGEKHAPVTGLESVPHVRDGTADIDAQRILKVCRLHNVFDIDGKIALHQLILHDPNSFLSA